MEVLKHFDGTVSSGPFEVTNKLLKAAGASMIGSLNQIFDYCPVQQEFPAHWKKSL